MEVFLPETHDGCSHRYAATDGAIVALAMGARVMEDLLRCSACDLAEKVRSRSISAVDIMMFYLNRVEEFNRTVNAICTLNPAALGEAAACDARLASGAAARALEGVPFVVKDNLDTKGLRTTFGSPIHRERIPQEDAIAVERLRNAGAILLGKTNTPEFAHDINTHNELFGTTRNPWNLNRSAGGSSGGTAAAIAAGFAPIGLGTDLGGSIRIPGSYCGLAGIRPAPGRVPVYPSDYGWDTLVPHVVGPMGMSAGDIALMLSIMSGPDDRDPSSLPSHYGRTSPPSTLKGRRIAYAEDLGGLVTVDPEVIACVRSALAIFEELGCHIESNSFEASDIKQIRAGTRGFGMVARYAQYAEGSGQVLNPVLARQLEAGLALSVRDVTEAERLRTQYWHRVRRFFAGYDYIVTPSVGSVAYALDKPPAPGFRGTFLFSYAFSVTGLPAATVHCGTTAEGLPVGLQVVGHRFREDEVLDAVAAYEEATPALRPRPHVNLESEKWMTTTPLTDFP